MIEKIVKVNDENGKVSFQKCRNLNLISLKDGSYGFRTLEGERVNYNKFGKALQKVSGLSA